MESIYDNILENETTVPIIEFEFALNRGVIRKIIKKLNLIYKRKEFINGGITCVYEKQPLYDYCYEYSKLSYSERLKNSRIEKFGNFENYKNHMINSYKKSCLEKYGVENSFQSEEIKNKIKQTNLEKYGAENPQQNKEVKEKTNITNIERYGKSYAFIDSYKCKRYKCNDLYFDSTWEIYFYYWLLKNNIDFEYQYSLYYTDKNNKKHKYKCDFYIKNTNEFIEIKNPAFINEKGELRTIYKKGLSDYDLKMRNDLEDCKFKCMKDNNVKIITDISFYKNWFDLNCKEVIIEKNY